MPHMAFKVDGCGNSNASRSSQCVFATDTAGIRCCSTGRPAAGGALELLQFGPSWLGVWINELHYDNAGTDVNEFVEVAGPAGTPLDGWSIVLYDGNGVPPTAYH